MKGNGKWSLRGLWHVEVPNIGVYEAHFHEGVFHGQGYGTPI